MVVRRDHGIRTLIYPKFQTSSRRPKRRCNCDVTLHGVVFDILVGSDMVGCAPLNAKQGIYGSPAKTSSNAMEEDGMICLRNAPNRSASELGMSRK